MPKNRLYLIDATAFCYRAFYALSGLSTSFGQPTNAIYGFTVILNKIIKEHKPEFLAICFDVSRDTFRQKKFADYKMQRPPMPDNLSSQIPLIKEIISAYGIAIFEKEGFEADDIIATLTKKAHDKGLEVTIVSSDKDILQLVDDNTSVFSPYKDEGIIYDTKKVYQRFGVRPPQIPDIIALMGDSADNIPSIPGIGEKTAVELINNFSSLKNLLKNSDKIKQEKLKKTVTENIEKIKLNSELAILCDNMDIDFDLDKIKLGQPNSKELYRLFRHLEFKKLLKDLSSQEDSQGEIKPFRLQDDELIIYTENPEDIIIHAKGKILSLNGNVTQVKLALSDVKIKKIGHDLKKIKVYLAKKGFSLDGLYFDTMIAAYLLNPSKTDYDLTDVAWDYLQELPSPGPLSLEKAVSLIGRLKPILEQQLKDKLLISLFLDIEMPLAEVLADMELTGIKLDTQVLEKLSEELEKRLIELIKDIYDISGHQFNINSPKQLREILFKELKLPVIKKSKTGPSTDEGVLKALAGSHKLPALLLEYRQLAKLKSTYVDTLPELIDKNTGRLHTCFNQTGTETGRLSSSNPNLQNIPVKTDIGRQIRRAIIAFTKDSYLLAGDYSQIELRILAHISQDEALIAAFKENKDIHKITASFIFGIEEKDVTDPMRETAKRVNFGITYGLTSYGLARDLGISLDQAQQFIDSYFLRYPKIKEYMQAEIQKAKKDGFVTTLLGRRRYIPEINNKNQAIRQFAERKAINTPIQGSASDLIKLAMIQIHNRIKQQEFKAKMILQVHDELVFDVPQAEINKFCVLAKESMEDVLKLDVPIRVVIKKGKNWLEMESI
jgi:DNA polymerase-1